MTQSLEPIPASARSNARLDSLHDLLGHLLADQQQLTAVEQFAAHHAASDAPAQAKYYSRLMPAAPPAAGQQYAFEVDLDLCSGCKACVTACHSLNGLDEHETWRDVGLLIGGSRSLPVMQHVTTACHHCVTPACMTACPVNAYEKDATTGIVRHLDDQCFGCQYCTLACPYDVPKYHAAKGIVRKCDMCSSRLAVGEAPACVQACPHEAIRIQVVDIAQVVEDAEAAVFLPAAPDPQITYPTTTYKTRRPFPRNMLPADYFQTSVQHPHLPLVVMLVLTQMSVGAFAVGLVLTELGIDQQMPALRGLHAGVALLTGLVALGASVFHLGRPRYAYRAVLGLRHSWLSREILAFGLFAGFGCAYAGAIALPKLWTDVPAGVIQGLARAVVLAGLLGVFCSVMIYATLGRELWSFGRTTLRFGLTTALLGISATVLSVSLLTVVRPELQLEPWVQSIVAPLYIALVGLSLGKLAWEAALWRHRLVRSATPLKRSALLMSRNLSSQSLARFGAGIVGGVFVPTILLLQLHRAAQPWERIELAIAALLIFLACLIGELLERYLFFAAVAVPRMPGAIR